MSTGINGWPDGAGIACAQSAGFGRALAAMGTATEALVLCDGARIVGHALAIRRGRRRLVSRGPVWAPDTGSTDRRAALVALRRAGPGLTVMNAEQDDAAPGRAGFLRLLTGATVAEWALAAGPAALRAGMDQKWRNRLKAGEGTGWTVVRRPMPADPAHWLLARDVEQSRARGYRTWPPALVAAWVRANPGTAWLWTAERGRGAPDAGLLVLRHGDRATWQTAWAGDAARAGHAMPVLLWRAAEWLAGQGVRCLDLGTVDTVQAAGLARFKLGTGAVARPLGGTWAGVRLW
ncbi:MAG: GNAT family N-acetyltransferase [Rhodobacteraceae bacterium]|nr:GNAT family N-acetyltransferase [Paracoccaceae bacterium]